MATESKNQPLTARFLGQHRLVQRAVVLLARFAVQTRATGKVEPVLASQFLEFFRTYLVAHQEEEERFLFPWLGQHGLASVSLSTLLREHLDSRIGLRRLEGLLAGAENTTADPLAFSRAAEDYAESLSAHDWKENHILYPLADLLDRSHELQAPAGEVSAILDGDGGLLWIEELERIAEDWPPEEIELHIEPLLGDHGARHE